jgi:hypothetical protein
MDKDESLAQVIRTERAETWVNLRRSETRRRILAPVANRLLHLAELPACRRLRPVLDTWGVPYESVVHRPVDGLCTTTPSLCGAPEILGFQHCAMSMKQGCQLGKRDPHAVEEEILKSLVRRT